MNNKDIVLLSELPMDTQLYIENSIGDITIVPKEDFLLEIEHSWRDYNPEIHNIYVAEPNPLHIDARTLLSDILEYYEDDQYDDWAQDMYDENGQRLKTVSEDQ